MTRNYARLFHKPCRQFGDRELSSLAKRTKTEKRGHKTIPLSGSGLHYLLETAKIV